MKVRLVALGASSCLALAICSGAPLRAETVEETATAFGLRQGVLDISLSPSGNRIAFVSPGPQGSEILNVIELTGDTELRSVMRNTTQNSDLEQCEWATEERLVCSVSYVIDNAGVLTWSSRLMAVGADGSNPILLTPRMRPRSIGGRQDGGDVLALDVPGEPNRILMTSQAVGAFTIGTRAVKDEEGLGVDWVDIVNGKRGRVEKPEADAQKYLADETGRVRLKMRHLVRQTGDLSGRRLYYYRSATSDSWNLLSEVDTTAQTREGYVPVAIDAAKGVAYGFDTIDGYEAIVSLALTEGARPQTLLARTDVDVDKLIRIGRQRRVVGASFATEKREVEYFDPELKKLAEALHGALPGKPLINIVGASADESKLLIVAQSDTDPGMVYLYDKGTRKLGEILPLREHLIGRAMGSMKPVTFPAADGTQIPGYLTLPHGSDGKNLPAIVMPHGGPSSRDEWGFDWLVQFFAARGYAVLQPNYRGSSGYGAAWYGRNGFQAWETAIGDVNQAGRWLVSQGVADPQALAIVGWSYGGYAALQSQVLDPALYKSVVAIAPVTDLERLRADARPYTNYNLVDRFIGRGAHVVAGSPAQHPERFTAPVMLVHGTSDQNVDVGHSRLMNGKLRGAGKRVEYVEYDDLDHSLSDGAARAAMLGKIDAFLRQSLKR